MSTSIEREHARKKAARAAKRARERAERERKRREKSGAEKAKADAGSKARKKTEERRKERAAEKEQKRADRKKEREDRAKAARDEQRARDREERDGKIDEEEQREREKRDRNKANKEADEAADAIRDAAKAKEEADDAAEVEGRKSNLASKQPPDKKGFVVAKVKPEAYDDLQEKLDEAWAWMQLANNSAASVTWNAINALSGWASAFAAAVAALPDNDVGDAQVSTIKGGGAILSSLVGAATSAVGENSTLLNLITNPPEQPVIPLPSVFQKGNWQKTWEVQNGR